MLASALASAKQCGDEPKNHYPVLALRPSDLGATCQYFNSWVASKVQQNVAL